MEKLKGLIVGEPAAIVGALAVLVAAILVLGEEFWWDWTAQQTATVSAVIAAVFGLLNILFVRQSVTANSHLIESEKRAVAQRQAK